MADTDMLTDNVKSVELEKLKDDIVADKRRKMLQEQESRDLDIELENLNAECQELEELLKQYAPVKGIEADLHEAEREVLKIQFERQKEEALAKAKADRE